MERLTGFLLPIIVYITIFILNAMLPGRWVTGYVAGNNSGNKLRYRLNGLPVLATTILLWVLLCKSGFIPWDYFYLQRWYSLAGAITVGLLFSFAIVLPYPAVKRWFIADFFLGRADNPRLWGGRVDTKMWLYLAGAIMLQLNILGFAAHHFLLHGSHGSPGFYLSAALLTFFVIDYLTFEEVHLYTYDFFAERTGFKLGWGCIAFYPYFYSVPLWATVEKPSSGVSTVLLLLFVLIFIVSWALSRGANLQKYYFKKDPSRPFLFIKPEVIKRGEMSLIVNGFWGISRHINYLGEIGMAIAIVLCTGYPLTLLPWLYPAYYILLLGTRQLADDRRCETKYGPLWKQYRDRVPYRIIPYIY